MQGQTVPIMQAMTEGAEGAEGASSCNSSLQDVQDAEDAAELKLELQRRAMGKQKVPVRRTCKGEKCFLELDPVISEIQQGLCKNCISEGPLKVAAQVRDSMLNADPAFPNKTVNEIIETKIDTADALQKVVECAFDLVLRDAVDNQAYDDPVKWYSRHAQTYADIMFCLRSKLPKFPVPNAKPASFTSILVNIIQKKFEEVVKKLAGAKLSYEIDQSVFCELYAVVSFIGHLYVRKLVSLRIICQVVYDLVGVNSVKGRIPFKQNILCVIELMYVIGSREMDLKEPGYMLMTQFIGRLKCWAATRRTDGEGNLLDGFLYGEDVHSSVDDLFNARCNEWPPRSGQIVVQYSVVTLEEATREWRKLKDERKLSPEEMEHAQPQATAEDKGSHLKITNMFNGSVMGVVFNVQEGWLVGQLKEEISNAISVHASCLQLLIGGDVMSNQELYEEVECLGP